MLLVFSISACFATFAAGLLYDIFESKVCYDVIGCFDNKPPFTNSWHELPDSPEKIGVNLTLHTKAGPSQGELLDFKDARAMMKETYFDPKAGIKVIIHGYMTDGSEGWVTNMRDGLLSMGNNLNVIVVNWGPGAHTIYNKAVANTRVVGAVIAHLLASLKYEYNVSMSGVHLLGHSLGAHISGYVGANVSGIARISGMDPAGPLFESTDVAVRIDPTDAQFVDCIHTDGVPLEDFGFGTMSAWCDVDFYPNGGGRQPGCPAPASNAVSDFFSWKLLDAEDAVSCSHSRSHNYYLSSFRHCLFRATPCDTYDAFQAGNCTCEARGGDCVSMGYHAIEARPLPQGKYYLFTTGTLPFC